MIRETLKQVTSKSRKTILKQMPHRILYTVPGARLISLKIIKSRFGCQTNKKLKNGEFQKDKICQ